MRALLTILCCSFTLVSLAQSPKQSLRIHMSYEKAGRYLEQAIDVIEAVNKVEPSTMVDYQAGRSVSLLPGFEAKTGSTFIALTKKIESEVQLQLTAYPNPFESSTTIEYYLPASGKVNLNIVDAQGRIVSNLVLNEQREAGKHQIEWKPTNAPPVGVYFPVVEVNQQKATNRLVKK